MDTLYVNNSSLVVVRGLKDEDGVFVNDANTVEVTLLESDQSTEVGGATWPLPLYHVPESNGDYEGDLPHDLSVTAGKRYYMKVAADIQGQKFEVMRTVKAETRYG